VGCAVRNTQYLGRDIQDAVRAEEFTAQDKILFSLSDFGVKWSARIGRGLGFHGVVKLNRSCLNRVVLRMWMVKGAVKCGTVCSWHETGRLRRALRFWEKSGE
jgi:hypothetical protein